MGQAHVPLPRGGITAPGSAWHDVEQAATVDVELVPSVVEVGGGVVADAGWWTVVWKRAILVVGVTAGTVSVLS